MRGPRPFNLAVATVIVALVGALGCNLWPIPGAEPEIEFRAREEVIARGECTHLEWEVQGAEDYPVFLDGEQVGASGTESVCPEETTMYELVVGAPGGSHEERVVVQVQSGPGPAPTSAPTSAPPPGATTPPSPPQATATPPPPAPPAATATPPPPAPPAATPTHTPTVTRTPTDTPTATVVGFTFDLSVAVPVESAGINSHERGERCPNGSFLAGLDLDRQGAYDPLDSPVVGQALCYYNPEPWGPCSWVGVETAGVNSHQAEPWCPEGQYIVSLDLDHQGAYDPLDSPVVGQARCCPRAPAASSHWRECSWVGVERAGINSHELHRWCPEGSYLAGMDLDRQGAYDPLDSPVVGQAYCCTPQ